MGALTVFLAAALTFSFPHLEGARLASTNDFPRGRPAADALLSFRLADVGSLLIATNELPAAARKTCNLRNVDCSSLSIPVNGLHDVSYGGWVRNLPFYYRVPSWREGSGGWGGVYFGMNNAWIECRIGTGSSASKKQFVWTQPKDEWHHVYFTRSGSTISFYLDGQWAGSQSGNALALKNNSDSFNLTSWVSGNLPDTDFSMVGLAFFSRALSAEEIVSAMNQVTVDLNAAPYNNGCVLAINCTEGEGDKVRELVSGQDILLSVTPEWNVDIPERQ